MRNAEGVPAGRTRGAKTPREITVRTVLFSLLGYFGVVIGVNAVMIKAATSTFGGVEVQSSYKAGLRFESELARAHAQEALHWHVDGRLLRKAAGEAALDLTVRDDKGAPVAGLTADARLAHPADERLDHDVRLQPAGTGAFHGDVAAPPGRWDLIVDLYRGDTRVFRSRSVVVLK
jgi:nitrogen fixation protein FixH